MEFAEIVDHETWEEHWRNCDRIHQLMRESQVLSDKIKLEVQRQVLKNSSNEHVSQSEEIIKAGEPYDKKVGVIAKTTLREILESNSVPENEIARLTTASYSKKAFNLSFPLLKPLDYSYDVKQQIKDA
ncbi:hypothetical protein [Rossellomorea aquimaris]|uniref:hypothetical protein n=1 Tax=Rossellomorea aquimaris TaxID=189382 RepID=UPI001CA467EA|nr:hypothetical protein [Rossellomorea aquimaris]